MITIEYWVNTKLVETHYKPNIAIANWFIKQLKETTHKLGKFKTKEDGKSNANNSRNPNSNF